MTSNDGLTDNDVAIVVAVGPLGRGKSRLGPTLDADARRLLVLAMLEDVLSAVAAAHGGPRYVVTPDEDVDPYAVAQGAIVIRDAGAGTNEAIVAALADERVAHAAAVLVLQGDLPQLAAEDVARCVASLRSAERGAVLVPNDDGGTSALGLRPPSVMATAFGPDSGERHRAAARTAGIELRELAIASIAADVDTVADLERVSGRVGPATAALLETLAAVDGSAR